VAVTLNVNGQDYTVDAEADTPLLWVIRDSIGMTGTKFGCGISQCGACTVHIDGVAARSCQIPASSVQGRQITTIEGISDGDNLHPVQEAWLEEDVPACGWCQSGQIMAAVSLLARNANPSDADIDAEMTNICRCGTYNQIRAAIHRAAAG
jgi:isoquinoline 1-oxidoreductase alpha subunit